MKQNVGLSAFILAAIMFAIRTGGQGPQPNQASRTSAPPSPPAATEQTLLGGPWMATRSFFHASEPPNVPKGSEKPVDFANPSSIRACVTTKEGMCRKQLADYFAISSPNQIQFLIASVPDPLHSRLALLTDSAIQAIEDAAQASGWIFAAEWLPWVDPVNLEEKDPEKRREQRETVRLQEQQPGILVFRQSSQAGETAFRQEVLLVFLAGETPTAGVNSSQFELARAYMRAIHEPSDEVRVLGPSFSGSFYSLVGLLKDDAAQGKVAGYRFRSGTVTGAYDGAIFQNLLGVSFRGATANTTDQDRFFRSALDDLGIKHERAAVLVEDESAYGKGAAEVASATQVPSKERAPIRVFRFPRDISHLRNAYKDAVAASKAGDAPSPDLEFSLKDPATGEDSIPVFSGSQSPLAQNGVINSIANAIVREGIQLVRVDATNVLDMLFLANVLKRQCPDTRLLLNYPDVLLVQAAQNDPLTGTLVLTSYPGFFASNNWMGPAQRNQPVTFPNGNAEGIYNATVLLLNGDNDPGNVLADYHWRTLPHPPTWLLTLDRQGFLPVSVFPHDPEQETNDHWFQQVPPPGTANPPVLPVPPRIWKFATSVIALFCLAVAFWIPWISSHPTCGMDARLSFLRVDHERGWRRVHILGLLLVLLLIDLTMGIPGLLLEQPAGFILLLALSTIAVLGAAGHVMHHLGPRRSANRSAWLGLAGAATCLGLWSASCFLLGDRGWFFAFRARELRFGSSPTWPVIASLGALALFAFVHLTRSYLAACQRPDIVTDSRLGPLHDRLRRARMRFDGILISCSGLRLAARMRLQRRRAHRGRIAWADPVLLVPVLAALVIAVAFLFRIDQQIRSIDGRSYNLLNMLLQVALTVLLLLNCVHIRLLWQSLQSFLTTLATLPLAHSFKPVNQSGASRPIWVRRLNLQSIDVHVQAIYVLHNMAILAKDAPPEYCSQIEFLPRIEALSHAYGEQIQELLRVDPNRTREEALQVAKTTRGVNKLIAKETLVFLRHYWMASLRVSPEVPPGESADAKPDPMKELADLAQRFVALHYTSFILYAVRQIQNLLVFVSIGFVLLMISLNCYTIQAPQFTGRLLMILFVILGATTVSCLAGLEKDAVLSRLGDSDPGKYNAAFFLKIAAYGGLPALSLLASEFPSISSFLLSWVEPTLEAFK